MAGTSKVTVDRSYFEALLRRADFDISGARDDHSANITISRVEYDSLLQTSREHQLLKDSLYQGGITEETLNLLITGADNTQSQRKDSGAGLNGFDAWDNEFTKVQYSSKSFPSRIPPSSRDMSWRAPAPGFNLAPGTAPYSMGLNGPQPPPRGMGLHRHVSYGISSVLDDACDAGFDDEHDHLSAGEPHMMNNHNLGVTNGNNEKRTLYFSGLSDRTTYQDLVSVIKGGKLLSIVMRERSATVFFLDGASEFLAWAKKNDIYLCNKRIEVKPATRQYALNAHIATKVASGATRNLLIKSASRHNLTESQIRDDMEHIHNLTIISVRFAPNGDCYMSTNSVHNALFARTCMMSRTGYRGCAIEFWPDECDVPLPVMPAKTFVPKFGRGRKEAVVPVNGGAMNRFGLLDVDGDSDEENRTPEEEDSEGSGGAGVCLSFLEE